jgi:hypothetical protein
VNRSLVATTVAVIYLPAGRHVDETVIDAWQVQLEDLDDGPDVVPLVRRLTRERGGFVRADEVWQFVTSERARVAHAARYQRPAETVAALEATTPAWDGDEPRPETPGEWLAHTRRLLAAANGPLADGLRHVMAGQPRRRRRQLRVDETYFFPPDPEPEPDATKEEQFHEQP